MDERNVVVLVGRVTADATARELASGAVVAQFDVAVREEVGVSTVPVAWFDPPVGRTPTAGDEVVVVGAVRRRFFRAGGATQSRTEVVAAKVVPARRRRDVERLLAAVQAQLAATPG